MRRSYEPDIEDLNTKLRFIESLLEQGNFKLALTEIEELQSRIQPDEFSVQAGELYYMTAFVLDKLGRSKQALTKAKRAYEILRNTGQNRQVAQIQQLMGRIYSKTGELKNAEIQFTDTASTYRRIGDRKGIAETYNELARVCFIRSEYGRATEYVTDALHLFQETNDRKMVAWVSGNLGTILMLRDRWGQAEEHLLQSLEANQALNDGFNVCKSLLSLGYLSCLLRKLSEADQYLKKAAVLINENNYLRELAILHEYQGSLDSARGEQDAAGRHFQEAIRIGEQLGPKGAITSQAYRLLAELQVESGDSKEALVSCDRSLLASKSIGERLEEAAVYRTLGRIYSHNGHAGRVRENFDHAIRILEEIGVRYELAKTYLFMAECKDFDHWEKLKYLGRAEDLASRLDTPYYLAKVHAGFAEMFLQDEKFEQAKDFLSKAKDVFRKLDERQDLEALSGLERKVEQGIGCGHSIQVGGSEDSCLDRIITQDEGILQILEKVAQVKDSDISILLEGETGTGKDLLAKAIHCASNRRNGQLVTVSCAERAEGLLESELFGHKRGSFTGAVADKSGFVEEATGGTLYLDEIAEVSPTVQVKLLRAIEEKEIVRVGEVKPKKVDFRVIAATNKDLDELVSQGKFRSDLFYRLNGIRFRLPALRERRNDIPLLVEHFLKKHRQNEMRKNGASEGQGSVSIPAVDKNVMELLLDYSWPGNIRELDNLVKQMVIFSDGQPMITEKALAGILGKLTVNNGRPPREGSLPERVRQYLKEEIEKALTEAGGNTSKAARILGIGEARLRYQIKVLGVVYPGKTD
jgi:transcriptional regulator with PAS, ATPase and Fis domain